MRWRKLLLCAVLALFLLVGCNQPQPAEPEPEIPSEPPMEEVSNEEPQEPERPQVTMRVAGYEGDEFHAIVWLEFLLQDGTPLRFDPDEGMAGEMDIRMDDEFAVSLSYPEFGRDEDGEFTRYGFNMYSDSGQVNGNAGRVIQEDIRCLDGEFPGIWEADFTVTTTGRTVRYEAAPDTEGAEALDVWISPTMLRLQTRLAEGEDYFDRLSDMWEAELFYREDDEPVEFRHGSGEQDDFEDPTTLIRSYMFTHDQFIQLDQVAAVEYRGVRYRLEPIEE